MADCKATQSQEKSHANRDTEFVFLFHEGQSTSPTLFGLLYDKDKGIWLYPVYLYTQTDSWHPIVTGHSCIKNLSLSEL